MMSLRFHVAWTLAPILVGLHALPFLPRPHRLFGIDVPHEIRYGTASRRALRRYQYQLMPWTAVALAGSLLLPASWVAVWTMAAALISLYAAVWLFIRRRTEIRLLALPPPSRREVPLVDSGNRVFRQAMLFVVPCVILGGTALYLNVRWDDIPVRFPVHWGPDGTPNGWSTRSVTGVFGPLLLGALTVLFILGVFVLTSWGSRRAALRPAAQMIPSVVACVIATAFSLAALLPLHVTPIWVVPALVTGSVCWIAALVWLSTRRRMETGGAAEEMTPETRWHGGLFYYDPNDPALFVEKRVGVGVTFNFGNRLSWLVLAALLLVPAGLVFLAFALTKP